MIDDIVKKFIDDSEKKLEEIQENLIENSKIIEQMIKSQLLKDSKIKGLNVIVRVKSPNSLKEKIIRNKCYTKYDTGEAFVSNLDDIIGVRIICLLKSEEEAIFKEIQNKVKDGEIINSENKLKLDLKTQVQPVLMKNGKNLYKIKCILSDKNSNTKVELQIKSLVHQLWGEVEHSLFYKSYNYVISSEFYSKLMDNFYGHLNIVDKQLETLTLHLQEKEMDAKNEELKEILCKLLHYHFSKKIIDKIGISIDLREIYEVVIECKLRSNHHDLNVVYQKVSTSIAEEIKLDDDNLMKVTCANREEGNSLEILKQIIKNESSDIYWKLFVFICQRIFQLDKGKELDKISKILWNNSCQITDLANNYDIFMLYNVEELYAGIESGIIQAFKEYRKLDFFSKLELYN